MKTVLSKLFALLSVLLLSAAVLAALALSNAPLVSDAAIGAADAQTERFMSALCSGDLHTAEAMLNGSPLSAPREPFSDGLTQTLWEAHWDTLSYQFHGSCYADDYGVYRNVTVTALDLPRLISDLQRYPSDRAEAAARMIDGGGYTRTHSITLQLTGHGGAWRIQPTEQLIGLMQGSTGGA